ncbi:MAG: ATP-dependent DNA helicase RecG [Anaerobutyricum sp.]|nr:ATP-dependent DNA helicase RecG [Eubacterium sp.]MDY6046377.1 ATP-dependent DNA helicase RecG [Anaerobutyricum sp.]
MEKNLSVRNIKGIGEKTEKLLKKLNIETVEDLVHHYPRCYMAYPDPIDVSDMKTGQRCSVRCEIVSPVHLKATGKLKICTCLGADQSGQIFFRWFNMPYLRNSLKQGQTYVFTGTPVYKNGRMMIEQPEYCIEEKYEKMMETYQPVYPLTAGLSNKTIQKAQSAVFEDFIAEEFLPETVRQYYDLTGEDQAIHEIHFPSGTEQLVEARKRIIFDEFFRFFSALELMKEKEHQALNHYVIQMDEGIREFIDQLPYELTGAQKKTLQDIRHDMAGTMAMNRLIQGDVGSGKTIVAMIALYAAVRNGYQGALMAPTEVLAEQHYDSFRKMLESRGVRIGLLTGSMKAAEKKQVKQLCESGELDIVIGTHAVIQDDVHFHNLALVVTDEQHRFGVKQRDAFMKKGMEPHVLVMSATPIPRTLGMILYRDLDVSIMNELPASRLPIKNCVVNQNYRMTAWDFIRKQVAEGHQAYVICPMIEESETMDLENVTAYASMLAQNLPPSICVQALNGKMSPAEKTETMEAFASNEIQVLVSTTVVEVGIDVPNATVMLIENAERFGLAQLHQLRGRVGRGKSQSYCIFISGSDQKEAMERLSVVGKSNDGFYIANEDLKLRGPGEFFGTKQSGTMNFALGDIYKNADIMKSAAEAVDYLKTTDYNFMKIHQYSLENDLNFARNL